MTSGVVHFLFYIALVLATAFVPTYGQAQTSNENVTSAPLPPLGPSPAPSLAPPPAGVTLTLPDGSPTLVPGLEAPGDQGATEPLRIGILSSSAPGDRQETLLPFREHLERSINRPVEFIAFREARGLVVAMQQKTILYAIAPGSVLAATHRLCSCVAPLGTQPNTDGSMGLFSVLIVPAQGAVQAPADVRSERLIIVGEGSVVAHQVGLSDLANQGLDFGEAEQRFAPSLAAAVALLQAGEADAILAWTYQADGATLFANPPAHQLEDAVRASLRIVWRSRPVVGLSHYAHRDLEDPLLDQLRTLLTQVAGTNGEAFLAVDQGSGRPFVEASITDYEAHLDALNYWSR